MRNVADFPIVLFPKVFDAACREEDFKISIRNPHDFMVLNDRERA
jgi:hypothetical protein